MFISFSLVPHFFWLLQALASPIFFLLFFFFFMRFVLDHLLFSFFFLCHHFLLALCREESFYCTVPITPVKREVEELDTIEEVSRVARLEVAWPTLSECQRVPVSDVIIRSKKFSKHLFAVLWSPQTPARNCGLDAQFAVIFIDVVYHHFPYNQYVLVLSPS